MAVHGTDGTNSLHSPGGVEVTIGASVIKKKFKQVDGMSHVAHLLIIYDLLKKKKVPNTDELIKVDTNGDPYILTKPIGEDRPLRTGAELFQATICILNALNVSLIFYSCTCF
jgi:hypothetical protein